VLRSVAAFTGA